jgi:hypothetical protein
VAEYTNSPDPLKGGFYDPAAVVACTRDLLIIDTYTEVRRMTPDGLGNYSEVHVHAATKGNQLAVSASGNVYATYTDGKIYRLRGITCDAPPSFRTSTRTPVLSQSTSPSEISSRTLTNSLPPSSSLSMVASLSRSASASESVPISMSAQHSASASFETATKTASATLRFDAPGQVEARPFSDLLTAQTAASAVSAVVQVGAAASGGLSASSLARMQAAEFITRVAACSLGELNSAAQALGDLSYTDFPLRFNTGLDGDALGVAFGALVLSTAITAAFAIAQAVLGMWVTPESGQHAMDRVAAIGASVLVAYFVPSILGLITMIGTSSEVRVQVSPAGWVAALVPTVLTLGTLVGIASLVYRSPRVLPPPRTPWTGGFESGSIRQARMRRLFGVYVQDARLWPAVVPLLASGAKDTAAPSDALSTTATRFSYTADVAMSSAIAVATSLPPHMCKPMAIATLAVSVAHLAFVALVRPILEPWAFRFSLVTSGLQAGSTGLAAYAVFQKSRSAADACDQMQLAMQIWFAALSVGAIIIGLRNFCQRTHKTGSTNKEAEPRGATQLTVPLLDSRTPSHGHNAPKNPLISRVGG